MIPSAPFQSVQRLGIRHDVAGRILTAIFHGQLPVGQRLVVRKLAVQFNVSATPVREALLELAGIGLIDNLPNRGAVVKPFGPRQIREIYHLRRILEAEAARCACGRLDSAVLAEVREEMLRLQGDAHSATWSERAMRSDVRLHGLISEHCGNDRLRDEIRRYNTLVQATRETVGNERSAQDRALAEHLDIVGALLSTRPELAAEAMTNHILKTAEVVEAAMFPAEERHEIKVAG
jgi:DNA-binding GntR family transcriptional regulator